MISSPFYACAKQMFNICIFKQIYSDSSFRIVNFCRFLFITYTRNKIFSEEEISRRIRITRLVLRQYKALIKRERKSSQVFACACLCLVWPPTCDDLWWLATNLSLFKFHRKFFSTCESLRVVWTQNTSRCESFLPARALELAEVSELYIGDSI